MRRSYKRFTARLEKDGLLEEVVELANEYHVSLLRIYQDSSLPSVVSARLNVYRHLSSKGYGNNEIARMFDRAQSGVSKLMRRNHGKADI